jgi:hypothetical protein
MVSSSFRTRWFIFRKTVIRTGIVHYDTVWYSIVYYGIVWYIMLFIFSLALQPSTGYGVLVHEIS